jgi:[ribosomal protein S5]-alanine N-acetyltransferase
MTIHTQRLTIKPLNATEMRQYLLDDFSLETVLKLEHHPRLVSDLLRHTIVNKILPNIIDTNKNELFHTFWAIIHTEQNTMMANLCFKGEPNELGAVEIGYGTFPDFQGKGIMTEAIGGLITWAFQQQNTTCIVAETDPQNTASIAVLKKNKFTLELQTKNNLVWKRNKTNFE